MIGHSWLYDLSDCRPYPGSRVRYNKAHGAMIGFATAEHIEFCAYSVEDGGKVIDHFIVLPPI